jgi:hypothetical protein
MDIPTKIIANVVIAATIGMIENQLPTNDSRRLLLRAIQAAVIAAVNAS